MPESTNNNHTSCILTPEHQRSCLGTTCWWKDKVHHHRPGYQLSPQGTPGKDPHWCGRDRPFLARRNTVTHSFNAHHTQGRPPPLACTLRRQGRRAHNPTPPLARTPAATALASTLITQKHTSQAGSSQHLLGGTRNTFTGSLPQHPHGAVIALGAALSRGTHPRARSLTLLR